VLLTVFNFLLIFIIGTDGSEPWWNYPNLELWKFLNLIVFLLVAGYFLKWRIREALKARGEVIKLELARAREERDQALAKLTEMEARFANIDDDVARVKERSQAEADAERQRIRDATAEEIAKIREQAKREIESGAKAARHELRRFAAQESVLLAEVVLKKEIGPEDDSRLTSLSVQELGRRTSV
jgi:F-type H+-transporting ATPase subunit b